jgi:tripartite-type tricarboxylate transporter receptor subunit TctC
MGLLKAAMAAVAACMVLVLNAEYGRAQQYPSKPITMVIPFAPGGASDVVARLIAQKAAVALGQQIVIDSRPGAGGTVAAGIVAKAPADGHTLLFIAASHAGIGALYPSLTFDPVADFVPVIYVASSPTVIVVNGPSRYRTLAQLVSEARARPGKLNFSGGGGGATVTNLAAEVFRKQVGIDVVSISYKGTGPAVLALMSDETDYDFDALAGVIGHVESGKLRALAVGTKNRSTVLPDVPTIAETILPGFDASAWNGVLAPKGTPDAIVIQLNKAFAGALKYPDVEKRLKALGVDTVGGSPAEFGAFLASETGRWGSVIRELGLTP